MNTVIVSASAAGAPMIGFWDTTIGRAQPVVRLGEVILTTAGKGQRALPVTLVQAYAQHDDSASLLGDSLSHEDVLAAIVGENSSFGEDLELERKERYNELLEEVRCGHLSRVAAERMRMRLSQRELAERAGMRQPNISRLEKLTATMSVRSARRLSAVFGIDYRELL